MAAAGTPKDDTGLERKMESRHLTMISLGGVIGTGLFVSSGYAIHQAGPLGAILAYAVGSLLVYCVMVSLGELSVAMPYAGSFHMYAKRFIGPGTAFTIAILYWLNWAVALASEFTAAGLLMQRWFPHSPHGCGRPRSSWWCSRSTSCRCGCTAKRNSGSRQSRCSPSSRSSSSACWRSSAPYRLPAMTAPMFGNFVGGGWLPERHRCRFSPRC